MTDVLDLPGIGTPIRDDGNTAPRMIKLDDDFTANLFMTDRGDASTAPICAEPGCENEVVKTSGKGPYPKYCPEHKDRRNDRTRGTIPAGAKTRAKWAQGRTIENNLIKLLDFIALPTAALPQTSPFYQDALLVTHYGPQIIHELVVLADDDPRLQRVLTRLATPGKYGALAAACGALILGVAANHGLLPPLVATLVANVNQAAMGGE